MSELDKAIDVRCFDDFPGVEWMLAHYQGVQFPKHAHAEFSIGAIESGALSFYYRGETVIADRGKLNLANAGEVHTGSGATGLGWRYRMFYLSPLLLQQAAVELMGKPTDNPYFQLGVIDDINLANQLCHCHRIMASRNASILEKQSLFSSLLFTLIQRHSDSSAIRITAKRPGRIDKTLEYLHGNPAMDVDLDSLARLASMSKFHFIRSFKCQTGLPPHQYQRLLRIQKIKPLLLTGLSVTDAAMTAGFFDLSHMSRLFKRVYGYSPKHYQQAIA